MSLRNIIPDKIHPEVWKNRMGDIDDIILYALNSFSPMSRAEFISDEKTRRMNKNTFHKHAKELKTRGYIDSYRDGQKSFYNILPLGENELSRRLFKYNLDFDTLVETQSKKNKNLANRYSKVFRANKIDDPEIQIEYLKLVSVITHDKLSEVYSKDEFNKLILYLTFNHPKFFPKYTISIENFIKKYNKISEGKLSKSFITTFIELVVEKKKYGFNFHKISVEAKGIELYFTEDSEYGQIFKLIVDSKLKDLLSLKNLGFLDLSYSTLQNTYDDIIHCLTKDFKLFHPELSNSLFQLIERYRDSIKQQIIKHIPNELIEFSTFSLLPGRKIKSKIINESEKKDIEKLNEMKLLIEINKIEQAKSILNKILIQGLNKNLVVKLMELVAELVRNDRLDVAKMVYEETLTTSGVQTYNLNSVVDDFIISYVQKELNEGNSDAVLKLIENYEKYNGEPTLPYLHIKISTLIDMGRDYEAKEVVDKMSENRNKYGVFIDSELYPDTNFSDVESLQKDVKEEKLKKSFDYMIGILNSRFFMKVGNYSHSLEIINEIFDLNIKTPKLYSLKAMNEINLELFEQALKTIDEGLIISPSNLKLNQIKTTALFKLRRYDDALAAINVTIELDPYFEDPDSSKNLVMKAWIFFYKDDLNNALKVVNEAYNKFPHLSDVYEIGSLIYDLRGKYEKALELINVAEEKGKSIIPYNKAQLLKNIKKYPEALATINVAIKNSLEDPINYQMKAMILAEMERYDEALVQINQSINLSDGGDRGLDSIKEQILQRKALLIANQGKKKEAIEIIKEAINFNPKWASGSYHVYGEILMIFENYTGAIEQFMFAIKLPFTPIETYIKLGKSYLELRRLDEALKYLEIGKYEAQHRVKKTILTKENVEIEQDYPQVELIEEAEKYIDEIISLKEETQKSSVYYTFLLLLKSKNGEKSYYTGHTNNLYRRLNEIRKRPPKKNIASIKLLYFDIFSSRKEAIDRSKEIDKLSEQEKVELINFREDSI
ncbi:hypothetical protein LCGC14_1218230 [marine sediment metagenome]|uniref:Uncharacterized protein n=1 Tax=marine sediment metagenome TaxID=412755 RepID=A0A0F9NUA9_9ZZZZ